MAITVIKVYTFPFAKNDDYIYLSSDKTEETQFRYGLHYLYDEKNVTNVDNQIVNGYIEFTSSNDVLDVYSKGDVIYYMIGGFIQYNPVPLLIEKIEVVNPTTYKFYFDIQNKIYTLSD